MSQGRTDRRHHPKPVGQANFKGNFSTGASSPKSSNGDYATMFVHGTRLKLSIEQNAKSLDMVFI
jgi:hypothetical protein